MTKRRVFAFELGTCSNSANQSGRMDEDNVEVDPHPKCSVNKISKNISHDEETAGPITHVIEIDEKSGPFEVSEVNAHPTVDLNIENSTGIDMETSAFAENFTHPIYLDKHAKKRIKLQITKHSDEYLPVFSFSEFFRDDKDLVKYKRTKIAFNVQGAIPVLMLQLVVFATRASLYRTLNLNLYFVCAFAMSVFAIGMFTLLLSAILLERYTCPVWVKGPVDVLNTNQHSDISYSAGSHCNDVDCENEHSAFTSNKKRVAGVSTSSKRKQSWNVRRSSTENNRITRTTPFIIRLNKCLNRIIHHWIFQEAFEAMAISGSFAIGLYLLARVAQGQCPPGVTIFQSQECNPVANAGSIPQDQVLLCYINPVVWQLLMKRTRFRTILLSWAIATSFVCAAVIVNKSYLQMYSVLYSLYFLYIHCETERFLRVSYQQNVMFIEAVFKQQKREKRHALEKVNYEYEVEKMKEKNRYFLEINHLKILMDNIAHNLRTPIQSINMGIELLKSEYSSLIDEHRIINKKGGKSELPFDFLIKTISASCVFMSMAINRSVDFTKINSNVGLVPNYETKKLEDVMNEPIDCIRTLQNTTPIKVGPIPKGVCTYIILDEIWVKESLLCLLSNSVRYSHGGVITINTEIITAKESDKGAYRETMSRLSESDDIELSDSSERTLSRNESDQGPGSGSMSAGLYIRITVMDNGVGIPADRREFIFQPLRPAKKPSGGTVSGTGLGLSCLFKRMEVLKGSCGMSSRSDGQEGSVFWFAFPYRPDIVAEEFNNQANGQTSESATTLNSFDRSMNNSSEDVNSSIAKGLTVVGGTNWAQRRRRIKKMPPLISAPSSAASQDLLANEQDEASDIATEIAPKVEPLRILIIEDSITIILIVTKLLEKKGHIVESEKNGFAGLNRLKEVFNTKNDFDLVLLDVQMPVLDGFECVSRYRAFEMEQIKNLNNVALNKSKTDTLKLLLHSKYFRINYANNLQHNSFNVDNFKYTGSSISASQSERPGNVSYEGCTSSNNDFSNFPSRMESVDAADTDDVSKDEASIASNSYSHKSDIVLRRGNMAIVGMSANNDNESRILALRKGMNFFITKPFSNSDLQNILNLFDS